MAACDVRHAWQEAGDPAALVATLASHFCVGRVTGVPQHAQACPYASNIYTSKYGACMVRIGRYLGTHAKHDEQDAVDVVCDADRRCGCGGLERRRQRHEGEGPALRTLHGGSWVGQAGKAAPVLHIRTCTYTSANMFSQVASQSSRMRMPAQLRTRNCNACPG